MWQFSNTSNKKRQLNTKTVLPRASTKANNFKWFQNRQWWIKRLLWKVVLRIKHLRWLKSRTTKKQSKHINNSHNNQEKITLKNLCQKTSKLLTLRSWKRMRKKKIKLKWASLRSMLDILPMEVHLSRLEWIVKLMVQLSSSSTHSLINMGLRIKRWSSREWRISNRSTPISCKRLTATDLLQSKSKVHKFQKWWLTNSQVQVLGTSR